METTTTLSCSSGCSLYKENATTNYNHVSSPESNIGESGTKAALLRVLYKFNGLSDGTIPANASITSATLDITNTYDYSANARTMRVYRQKRAWVVSQATWNIYATGNSWQTAGGFGADDCEQTEIGSHDFTADEPNFTHHEFELNTTKIWEIVAGIWTNNGFLLKMDVEANDAYSFATLSHDTTSYRPVLKITWAVPTGGAVWFLMKNVKTLWDNLNGIYKPQGCEGVTLL